MIPFFSIIEGMFMSNVLNTLTRYVDIWFIGLSSAFDMMMKTMTFIMTITETLVKYQIEAGFNVPVDIVLTGHTSGGLYAKSYAAYRNLQAVTFESPKLENSRMYELLNRDSKEGANWGHLINVYSPSSLLSVQEDSAVTNVKLPTYQSYMSPANVYSTFCHLAAACVSDDRYDHFCSYAVGPDAYMKSFEEWERPRDPIDAIYLKDAKKKK